MTQKIIVSLQSTVSHVMIRPSSAVSDILLRAKLPLEVGALHVTTDFTNPERSGGLPARGQARMRRSVNAMFM